MNYFVSRDGQQYGPYTLADLQRYLASGNILPTDMARSEGMQDWVPVSQITGNIDVNAPAAAPQGYGQVPTYAAAPGYPQPGQPLAAGAPELVPDLHWGLVLLFGFLSCGLFLYIWMFFQALAAKRLDPRSNAIILYIIGAAISFGGTSVGVAIGYNHYGTPNLSGLLNVAGWVLIIVGHFNIKSSLESYFNTVERIGLRLSGVMTFFFGTIYLQYHFNRINRWRRTGVLY
jgi:hypothetical protein